MPVSIDDFESGDLPQGPSVPEQVVVYLHTHRDQAFTRSEIASAIGENPNTVGTALSRLKQRQLVRHKGEYWAITDDRDRVESAYDLHTVSEQLDGDDGGIDANEWDTAAPDTPHPSEQNASEDTT
jgi:Mn-dependent DtxR family transcriptional regulator